MPIPVTITPRGGVSRYPDVNTGDPNIAFDLNNCRLFRSRARALREGTSIGPIVGEKPYFLVGKDQSDGDRTILVANKDAGVHTGDFHNGFFYGTTCTDPADQTIANDGEIRVFPPEYDPAVPGNEVQDMDDVPRITNASVIAQIPSEKAKGLEFTNDEETRIIETGVTTGKFVTYALVPINSREEAGPWKFVRYQYDYSVPATTKGFEPIMRIDTAGDVQRVEVYRTAEYDGDTGRFDSGESDSCAARPFYWLASLTESIYDNVVQANYNTNLGVLVANAKWDKFAAQAFDYEPTVRIITDLVAVPQEAPFRSVTVGNAFGAIFGNGTTWNIVDDGMTVGDKGKAYYVDVTVDLSAVPTSYINYQADIANDTQQISLSFNTESPDSTVSGVAALGKGVFFRDKKVIRFNERRPGGDPDDPEDDEIIVVNQGGETLSRPRLVLKQGATEELKSFCAGAMYYDAGTMLYGAPTWPTARPAIAHVGFRANNRDVRVQYEYEANGKKYYGPFVELPDVQNLVIERLGGEIGVVVMVNEGGNWVVASKVPLGGTGQFYGSNEGCFTYRADEYVAQGTADESGNYPVTEYLYEPNKIFLSRPSRPLEVTFLQAALPGGETVRYIGPARLDKDEGIASYSMYIASDKAIYHANRKGDALMFEQVTAKIGVALGDDGQPLWATGHYGGYFVGTDGHLYSATGREIRPLDDNIIESPGYGDFFPDLWSTIYDVAYHIRFREVWVATDTGVYCMDMGDLNPGNRRGVVAKYELTNILTAHPTRLFYDPESADGIAAGATAKGNMIAVVDGQPAQSLSESGDYLEGTTFVTGFLADGVSRVSVDRIEIDYDPMPTGNIVPAPGTEALVSRNLGSITFFPRQIYPALTPANTTVYGAQTLTQMETHLPRYPRAAGVGIRIQFSGFEELRSMSVMLLGAPKNS